MVGCRLNQAEIEAFARDFCAHGYDVVESADVADIIVVNTCCVTQKAAADSRKMLRHYQRDSDARVIGTGCWNSAFPEEAQILLGGTNSVSNQEKHLITDRFPDNSTVSIFPGKVSLGPRQRTRAFVKVQDGCNNRCSYCLTHIARGVSRSEPIEKILQTVSRLVESGTKEVVLTGVQLGSWGKDLGEARIFQLIDALLNQTSIPRIRLSSIEPWDVSEELIKRYENPRLLPHLHIPVQSGSDNVLRRMRRPSTSSQLKQLFQLILTNPVPIALTTDIIVGFPAETENDLSETINFIQDNGFSGGHVFKFSPMPGTDAATMANKIADKEKKERLDRVQACFNQLRHSACQNKVGKNESVLFETQRNQTVEGYTPDFLRVSAISDLDISNTIQRVLILNVTEDHILSGKIVNG